MKKLTLIIVALLVSPPVAVAVNWKVPDGYTVKVGRALAVRSEILGPTLVKGSAGAIWGPEIFGTGKALELGFRPIRRETYDFVYYTADPTETDTGTEFVRGWTNLTPKYTVGQLKTLFNDRLKSTAKPWLKIAREWIDYYTEFDSGSANLALWQVYITDLKAAYQTIRVEVHPTITDYDELVTYIKSGWQGHIPPRPE